MRVEESGCEPERERERERERETTACGLLFFFSRFVSPAATALSLAFFSKGLLAPFFERECASSSFTKSSLFSS